MAEFKEISTKRKRPSIPTSHSLMGIFTRSKSQIHLHRNRSGKSRPDLNRGGNHQDLQPFVKKRKNSSAAEDSTMEYDLSSVSIRDLRLRRVFSPSSTDGLIPNGLDDVNENMGKSEAAGSCLAASEKACENGDLKKLDMSNEDFVQSTPPDAEIFGAKQGVERNESSFLDQFLEKKRSQNLQNQEERNGTNYPIKSVLKPCSRVKLFKAPGSFSYRRLLPYLLDMEKDHSRSPTMGHSQNKEHGFEEKQLLDAHNNDSSKELKAVSVESFTSQDNGSSSMPPVNGEIQKLELQVSREDRNLNFSELDSSSTIRDSHFNEENLSGVGSSDKMLMDDGKLANSNVESPCNAQNPEDLNQTLSTVRDKCDSCDYDKVAQNSNNGTKRSEIEGMPKTTIFHPFEARHLNSASPVLSEVGGNRNCSTQQIFENDGEVVDQVEGLNAECMLKTPPDSDLSSKSKTDDSRGNRVDSVSEDIGEIMQNPTNETFHRNNDVGSDKSLDSSPKNNLVPNTRTHLKLSKILGSFSYRRLLPFLIAVSGNDQSPEVEKSSKEKPLSPLFPSGKDMCMETFNDKSCPVEHHTGDDPMLPVAEATSMRCSSDHKLTQSPPKQVADSPMITDLNQEWRLPVKPAASDTNQKLETSPKNVVSSAMTSSSVINSGLVPREEVAELVAYQLSPETEDCIKSTKKCGNREKQVETDSFVKASNPPGIPSRGLKRGILKRNPRGCRGVCSCLNCSSFRLHAERSFEFSRNQMQDAEEVALDLIKELAYLRNMLEKSTFDGKDHISICINQVKEACRKASDAEELAKTRLGEMNYDLNIHCRIPCGQRPRVRFADNVEEVIPITESSNK
ncbi:hypothetical protein PTKIN_Ptkin09bG0242900 [Pterospermum kingtungense]